MKKELDMANLALIAATELVVALGFFFLGAGMGRWWK